MSAKVFPKAPKTPLAGGGGAWERTQSTGNIFELSHSEETEEMDPVLQDLTVKGKIRRLISNSWVGYVLEVVNVLASLLSCTLFVISTYQDNSLYDFIDHILLSVFLLDFIMQISTSVDWKRFLISPNGIVDLVTIVPTIVEIITDYASPNNNVVTFRFVRFVRVLRVFRLMRVIRSLGRNPDMIMLQQYISLGVLAATLIFISGGVLQVTEELGTHPDKRAFHDWIYYVVVLISGVGLGDILVYQLWSKLLVFIIFAVLLAILAFEANKLNDMIVKSNKYTGVSYTNDRDHVVLCGFLDDKAIESFFDEFFHPDHEQQVLDVVIIQPGPPGEIVEKAMRASSHQLSKVDYISGALSSEKDLTRAAVDTAVTVFLSSDKASTDPLEADLCTIVLALSLKHFVRNSRLKKGLEGAGPKFIVQLLLPDSVDHLSGMGGLSQRDNVMCVNLLRMQVMSKTASCPGFSTIIRHLVTSTPRATASVKHLFGDNAPTWACHYLHGCGHELYCVPLHPSTAGHPFSVVAESAYQQWHILLIGIQICNTGKQEHVIVMNPGHGILPEGAIEALVVAQDYSEAALLSSCTFDPAGRFSSTKSSKKRRSLFERMTSVQMLIKKPLKINPLIKSFSSDDVVGVNTSLQSRPGSPALSSPTLQSPTSTSMDHPHPFPLQQSHLPHPPPHLNSNGSLFGDPQPSLPGHFPSPTAFSINRTVSMPQTAMGTFSSSAGSLLQQKPSGDMDQDSIMSAQFLQRALNRNKKFSEESVALSSRISLNASGVVMSYSKAVPLAMASDLAKIKTLKGHIIYCGNTRNLYRFLAPLRLSHLHLLRPVVILSEQTPLRWKKIGRFPLVYYVKGNPKLPQDLFKASIATAYSAVVMWTPCAKPDCVSSVVDSESIFAHNSIVATAARVNPLLHVATEVSLEPTIGFFVGNEHYGGEEAMLSSSVASGEAALLSGYDSLMCQCFFNGDILDAFRSLTQSGASPDGVGLTPSNVHMMNVPFPMIGSEYSQVVMRLLKSDGIVVLGIRREDLLDGNTKPYAVTNPPWNLRLRAQDQLYVLSQTQPEHVYRRIDCSTMAHVEAQLAEVNDPAIRSKYVEDTQQQQRQKEPGSGRSNSPRPVMVPSGAAMFLSESITNVDISVLAMAEEQAEMKRVLKRQNEQVFTMLDSVHQELSDSMQFLKIWKRKCLQQIQDSTNEGNEHSEDRNTHEQQNKETNRYSNNNKSTNNNNNNNNNYHRQPQPQHQQPQPQPQPQQPNESPIIVKRRLFSVPSPKGSNSYHQVDPSKYLNNDEKTNIDTLMSLSPSMQAKELELHDLCALPNAVPMISTSSLSSLSSQSTIVIAPNVKATTPVRRGKKLLPLPPASSSPATTSIIMTKKQLLD